MRLLTVGLFTCALALVSVDVRAQAASASASPAEAQAGAAADPQAMREELERLRQTVAALEARLVALEAKSGAPAPGQPAPGQPAAQPAAPTEAAAQPSAAAPATQAAAAAPTTAEVPSGAAGAGGPDGALPVYGNTSALSKVFNPDMAVIGDFLGAAGKNRNDRSPALDMHESEASFQAVVDPYARADFFISFGPEGVEVEEGFITFTALPGGLLAKVGKMRSQFGKVNAMHNHVLPWADRPLVTQNLVGGEEGIDDSGISVSRLIMNPVLFLEATGEVFHGDSAVFSSHKRSDLTYVGRLRGYRDLSEGTNLDLGTSIAYGHSTDSPQSLDATTRLVGVDATFRYRPLRRAIYKRFIARTEMIWSDRDPTQQLAVVGDQGTLFSTPAAKSFGYYASGEYQFARRWFAGARWDWSERATDPDAKDKGGSLLLTYWPSEFSQVRGQYRRTSYADGTMANEVLFQLLFSIGAHGAHTF
jgi:hypothetical protein